MVRTFSLVSWFFASLSIVLLTMSLLVMPERAYGRTGQLCTKQSDCPAGYFCNVDTHQCEFDGECPGCTNACGAAPNCPGNCNPNSCPCGCLKGQVHPDICYCQVIIG